MAAGRRLAAGRQHTAAEGTAAGDIAHPDIAAGTAIECAGAAQTRIARYRREGTESSNNLSRPRVCASRLAPDSEFASRRMPVLVALA